MTEIVEVLNTLAANSPETGAVAAGGIALSKVLGPSVTAVGRALGDFTDWRMRNLLKLSEKTQARETLGEGEVHPRVAQQILSEASWSEDDVAQEYFAGMLIGSRNLRGSEMDTAYFARVTAGLTAVQLRLHHMVYEAVSRLGTGNELRTRLGAKQVQMYFPMSVLPPVFGLPMRELGLVGRAAAVLEREDLIGEYVFDPSDDLTVLKGWFPQAREPGLALNVTGFGAQAFLMAYGVNETNSNALLSMRLPHVATEMPRADEVVYGPTVRNAPSASADA
ncbi:hypothetical protein ABKW28_11710 [Nocardioides sp. 31GB23]|uniref:hypothetical protein n=1 Tax=Nocardioides sp. 31GB23 TaxID=3156065 RepID=UPI0032AEBC15